MIFTWILVLFFVDVIEICLTPIIFLSDRLVDIAPHYYDLSNFPQCEAKRVLEKLYKKREKEKDEARNRK